MKKTSLDLRGLIFIDKNLKNKNLSRVIANHVDFSKTNLENSKFDGASLKGALFIEANMKNTSLVDCDITGCDFTGANLENSNFSNTKSNHLKIIKG